MLVPRLASVLDEFTAIIIGSGNTDCQRLSCDFLPCLRMAGKYRYRPPRREYRSKQRRFIYVVLSDVIVNESLVKVASSDIRFACA